VGARIANSRGTPGTLGCFALTLDDRKPVMLTSQHVLFGAGGQEQEPVWMADGATTSRIARTRHGRRGTVHHGDIGVHVDCAMADLTTTDGTFVPEAAGAFPAVGHKVHKVGASTGTTSGTVLDTDFSETVRIEGRTVDACAQILVGAGAGETFHAAGDSGAALRNDEGEVVGLIWGASARGDAIACPIAPVLWVLHVQLARRVASGVRP